MGARRSSLEAPTRPDPSLMLGMTSLKARACYLALLPPATCYLLTCSLLPLFLLLPATSLPLASCHLLPASFDVTLTS